MTGAAVGSPLAADAATRTRLALRSMVLLALALESAWAIYAHTYVAYLAHADPQRALRVRAGAEAAFTYVERQLASRPTSATRDAAAVRLRNRDANGDPDRLRVLADLAAHALAKQPDAASQRERGELEHWRALVVAALARDPMQARGLRLFAQVQDALGLEQHAERIMRVAARLNQQETVAVYAMMVKAYENNRDDEAIAYADTLLRTQSALSPQAVHVISAASRSPAGIDALVRRLHAAPPWRARLFALWPDAMTDARAPLDVLLRLQALGDAPTAGELAGYLAALIKHGFYDLAYYTWLQFLPREQLERVATPYNGSFEWPASDAPFDWSLRSSPGVRVAIVPRPGSQRDHALAIEFGLGRVDFRGVAQIELLPPGRYRFNASYLLNLDGRRGLVWAISCIDGAKQELGRSRQLSGTVTTWTQAEFEFEVPQEGCRAQTLRLFHDARSASEQLVQGTSLHDDVAITRLDTP